jgi:hypothetical protein
MKRIPLIAVSLLAAASLTLAQDVPPAQSQDQNPAPGTAASDDGWRRIGADQQSDPQQGAPAPGSPANFSVPPQLTIRPGTFVTVRVNQALSSDRNHEGDAFSATLVQPIIVDGVVVAQPGQTIGGHVTMAQKAGRVEGTAKLGIQLTDLSLVDGQQLPIQSALISRNGPTSVGRDAGAIAGTTGVGAAIGAAAAGGTGAAIGAGAGAAASVIGVLLTRGRPSIIYPESVLTFRVEAPVTFSTERAPQAFRFVNPNDYSQTGLQQRRPGPPPPPYYGPGYAGYNPYYYGYGPGFYGPGVGLYYGPGFYFGGRGYYRFRR